ncbi:hypothetical protein MCP1_40141 [Candidatus Terasakiella magnetica]|nr:hypothetical protein MCP1_40141 [Candidatus Terasakiella magnetica]
MSPRWPPAIGCSPRIRSRTCRNVCWPPRSPARRRSWLCTRSFPTRYMWRPKAGKSVTTARPASIRSSMWSATARSPSCWARAGARSRPSAPPPAWSWRSCWNAAFTCSSTSRCVKTGRRSAAITAKSAWISMRDPKGGRMPPARRLRGISFDEPFGLGVAGKARRASWRGSQGGRMPPARRLRGISFDEPFGLGVAGKARRASWRGSQGGRMPPARRLRGN